MALTRPELIARQALKITSNNTSRRAILQNRCIELEGACSLSRNEFNAMPSRVLDGAKLGTDGTVRTTDDYGLCGELRSRFYTGEEFPQMKMFGQLYGNYAVADWSSATHIHYYLSDLIGRNLETPAGVQKAAHFLTCLTSSCKRYELGAYALSGANNRRSSDWSEAWSASECRDMRLAANCDNLETLAGIQYGRTMFLNLRNLRNSSYEPNKRTIEFRCFSATQAETRGDFDSPSGLHITSAMYFCEAMLATARAEMTKDIESLRWENKSDTHYESVKWMFHHSGKAPFVPYFLDYTNAHRMRHYFNRGALLADGHELTPRDNAIIPYTGSGE